MTWHFPNNDLIGNIEWSWSPFEDEFLVSINDVSSTPADTWDLRWSRVTWSSDWSCMTCTLSHTCPNVTSLPWVHLNLIFIKLFKQEWTQKGFKRLIHKEHINPLLEASYFEVTTNSAVVSLMVFCILKMVDWYYI